MMYGLYSAGYAMTAQQIIPSRKDITLDPDNTFTKELILKATIASHDIQSKNFDLSEAQSICTAGIASINTKDGLQTMLAAQMLTIHQLQQKVMSYANGINNLEIEKYYTSAALKLANCFVQQANLMAKLQGAGGQKIIVEHVDIHQGGQAIVGNIQGGMGNKEK